MKHAKTLTWHDANVQDAAISTFWGNNVKWFSNEISTVASNRSCKLIDKDNGTTHIITYNYPGSYFHSSYCTTLEDLIICLSSYEQLLNERYQ